MKPWLILVAVAGLAVTTAQASQLGTFDERLRYEQDGANKFAPMEMSFDAFGSYIAGERRFSSFPTTNIRHGRFGGGVGLNYFFTRNLGLGADINIPDNGGNFVDSAAASVIGRLPIDSISLAPYALAGGGRQFDPVWKWFAHVGGGLEFRLNHYTGIFSDARYVWADAMPDYVYVRAGLRFAF
jgi:hypothetical protein